MKKILLLTASYGTGHITATNSLNEIFHMKENVETKIIDFLKIENQDNKDTFFQKLYNFSMEKPIIFDTFFTLTNNRFCCFILKNIINLKYKIVKKLFDDFQPDIIISTHPYWNFIVKRYKKYTNTPYICIITDSYMIHKAWIDKSVDYYCVMDEDTKHILINSGIRNIYVTGFPVHPKLFEDVEKNRVLRELGLQKNKTTILIAVGLAAKEKFSKIIDFLRKQKYDFQLIVVTGKYKDLYEEIKNKDFVIPTAILGWTNKMYEFLKVSDLVICKGGGAIVSESLSAKCPVFIPLFVPGQERGNAYIIKKYKMGFYEEELEKVYKVLEDILSKKIDLQEYKKNIERYIHNNPANIIANIVMRKLNEE